MMRIFAPLLILFGLSLPVEAQTFDEVFADLEILMRQADEEGAYLLLSRSIRNARATGNLDPDFAIFYAILTDMTRNNRKNPAYALQIAEEGLELIAGDPGQVDFRSVLEVSRAYALADLGRFNEAALAARLLLPAYRRVFGDELAAGFTRDAEPWSKGLGSAFNTPATELARAALDQAKLRFNAGEFGAALTLTGTAIIPLGTELAEAQVRSVNAEAEYLSAKALDALGRRQDSGNAFIRALGYLTSAPWQPGQDAIWWGPNGPNEPGDADLAFNLFTGIANAAMNGQSPDLAAAALEQASLLVRGPDDRVSLLLFQAALAFRAGAPDQALEMLLASGRTAKGRGDETNTLLAAFYVEIVRLEIAVKTGTPVDPKPLIEVTNTLLAHRSMTHLLGRDFILATAAPRLLGGTDPGTALAYAHEALALTRAFQAGRNDTGFGRDQARVNARAVVETFLKAAHDGAALGLDPSNPILECPRNPGFFGCVVVAQ